MGTPFLLARPYRFLPKLHVLGFECCVYFTRTSSSGNCYTDALRTSTREKRWASTRRFVPGNFHQERQRQLWEDLFSNPAEWWDNRLDKRGPGHPDFRHKLTKAPLWLNNQQKPPWVDSQLADLHAALQSGCGGAEGVRCPERDELQILCEKGHLGQAVDALGRRDTVPSLKLFKVLLKACVDKKDLIQAKRAYAHLAKHGLEAIPFVGEYVVSTMIKCGGLEDALGVFHLLPDKSVFSWTAVISGLTTSGREQEALKMYEAMKVEGVQPTAGTFVSLLKACGSLADLDAGRRMHGETSKFRCDTDLFVGTCLVEMYAKCGSILDARNLFDGFPQRSVVTWNAMLRAYVKQGHPDTALQLYDGMAMAGVSPNARTFVSAFQACGMLADEEVGVGNGQTEKWTSLEKGRSIHADAKNRGSNLDPFVGSALVNMYGKCGSIADAQFVFDNLSERDVVSWTAMLTAYAKCGRGDKALQLYRQMQKEGVSMIMQSSVVPWNAMLAVFAQEGQPEKLWNLYEQMRKEGVSPTCRTFVSVLQGCGMHAEEEDEGVDRHAGRKVESLVKGKEIHSEVWRKGYDMDVFVRSSLVSMYVKCGSVLDAQCVFDGASERDVVSWTAILAAYLQKNQAAKALQLYEQMHAEGVRPDVRTFVSVLQACSLIADDVESDAVSARSTKLEVLAKAKTIHAEAWRRGFGADVFLGNTLTSLYGKCGSIADAEAVFDNLSEHGVVSWNAMLAGYIEQGQAEKGEHAYYQMREEGVSPDVLTYVAAVQFVCMLVEAEKTYCLDGQSSVHMKLQRGKALHADARRKGWDMHVLLGNTLIFMYRKCGSIVDAQNVFDGLPQRNVVSWNGMLAAYSQEGQGEEVLHLFKEMVEGGQSPDEVTFVSILQACSSAGSLDLCRQIHRNIASTKNELSPLLASSLIHAYGRCASMVEAQAVFDALPRLDRVCCSALIAGYAREGNVEACFQGFEAMWMAGIKPDRVTFLSLLSACCHGGLVDKGIEYFESMSRDHGVSPEIEHYATMVDLLGRAGCFAKVERLLLDLPMQPSMSLWSCLLGACRKHGKVALGRRAFEAAVRLNPKYAPAYVVMSSIYADASLWEHAKEVRLLREKAGAWKLPGQSWVELERTSHSFVVEDQGHLSRDQLYAMTQQVTSGLRMEAPTAELGSCN